MEKKKVVFEAKVNDGLSCKQQTKQIKSLNGNTTGDQRGLKPAQTEKPIPPLKKEKK